jgi:hypothetical protein
LQRAATQQPLVLLLSPLEQALVNHAGRPFTYLCNGLPLYVSAGACRQLLDGITQRLQLLESLQLAESRRQNIPHHLRELFDDPAEVFSLPPYLRVRLVAMECYTMLSIIHRGRSFFAGQKGFGSRSLHVLDELFAKHNCSHLFC